ncbi:MAG TPA: hypothetical protein DCS07_17475 [Bdellovibrionales bacterium]|nr:MAG: hypothetical protein A2Z97_12375 [Bdellovibrionales bacterium GWB1_52_6]OFZ03736.1 MAG: hypothetical protein A2X97_14355 [Bdellovibrionales bacterium GWA1_52_35]OFZ35442.1 MAG: hypothetical protein A2070_11450 [Bdellovibrionales bacterium GWC1_52_8]HAR44392.1 hypothetical protein [Bdellovibrionales bacterium]HCM38751.1 hypothetical protein [Bdellovibrionales bacterium]
MIQLDVQIIAETDRWLVANKPAGCLTIPGHPSSHPSSNEPAGPQVPVLSLQVQEQFGRIWVVHRLDRDTSGVVLFARSAEAHRQANRWFSSHQVQKTYSCLAQGRPATPVFRINNPIQGAHCVTQVEVRERYSLQGDESGFLALVKPLTGRRHQIRIHLAQAGFPLWGDLRYLGPSKIVLPAQDLSIPRVALHAARLELPAEYGKKSEIFEAPWPEDFQTWVTSARRTRG